MMKLKNRRRTVLIAENNRAIAQVLRLHLERIGFSVFVAYDGDQAAVLAARQRYELMIVNLEMPLMNGTEFCQHVREELGLTEVPIAICASAGSENEIENLIFNYGITRVFYKPIDPKEVVEVAKDAVEYLVAAI